LVCVGVGAFLSQPDGAAAFDRNRAQLFAVLPDGATHPEGLAVAPNGDVYVAMFDGSRKFVVYNSEGKLLRTRTINSASSGGLLGLGFNPQTGDFLVIDFGAAKVLKVDPHGGGASDFITLAGPLASTAGLNAMTFDPAGNVYVSDSFNGAIWKSTAAGASGLTTPWFQDTTLLKTTGVPPFGANGLAFNKAQTTLFVANTGNDTIVQIPVSGGAPSGTASVFVNSINGADGLIIDGNDDLWVAANQSDEIVVLDKTGKVIAKLGDFDGIADDGTPRGLLFPASPGFSRDKKTLFVTNLGLDLRGLGIPQSLDSQWAADVQHWTVSKIDTRFQALPNK
jgi:hypothetical protein